MIIVFGFDQFCVKTSHSPFSSSEPSESTQPDFGDLPGHEVNDL
jgi:hypothetical protein